MAQAPISDRRSRRVHTVLVCDDDEQVRALVWEVLAEEGIRVVPARHGEEALEVIAKLGAGVDLLLADVVMPLMGGRELALKAQAAAPHLKILFMSGYGDVGDFQGEFPAGVEVIAKPFGAEDLIDKVKTALKSRK
jgi:CheY-like chemotaxis protein